MSKLSRKQALIEQLGWLGLVIAFVVLLLRALNGDSWAGLGAGGIITFFYNEGEKAKKPFDIRDHLGGI